jgi:DNA-binding transcriptional LysR family regulator
LEGVVTPGCKILIKAPGCAYRERLESWLEAQGVSQFDRLEFGTLDAIVGCVEAGLGFTMLPRSVLERANGRGNLQLHKLPPREGEVETLFIRRNDIYEFSALRAFLATTLSVQAGSALPNAEGSSGER